MKKTKTNEKQKLMRVLVTLKACERSVGRARNKTPLQFWDSITDPRWFSWFFYLLYVHRLISDEDRREIYINVHCYLGVNPSRITYNPLLGIITPELLSSKNWRNICDAVRESVNFDVCKRLAFKLLSK